MDMAISGAAAAAATTIKASIRMIASNTYPCWLVLLPRPARRYRFTRMALTLK
jgi:hypothetical protein